MESNQPSDLQDHAQRSLIGSTKRFAASLLHFLKVSMDLKKGLDKKGITDSIIEDINFTGHNAWILICSIFIACIGLNMNSTAVIIGAMLISPLMSPILGIGLGIGTLDWKLLSNSSKNFAFAIVISLAVSVLYFTLTPIKEATEQLISRTRPTLLDVLIALFGGFAGIIAESRKEMSNAIPGVAIATALMPPLCTAGFGLASGDMELFLGAFYLFFLNSVFICIATFLIIKYLRLPLKERVDKARDRKVRLLIGAVTLLIIVPSGFLFVDVVRESIFKQDATLYVKENFDFPGTEVMKTEIIFTDSIPTVEVFLIGENLSSDRISDLKKKMPTYNLHDARLKIYQSNNTNEEMAGKLSEKIRTGIIEDIYRKKEEELHSKDERITFLEGELVRHKAAEIPFPSIVKEVKAVFPGIERLSYANLLRPDGADIDTVHTFLVQWQEVTKKETMQDEEVKLAGLLRARLNVSEVKIVRE